MRDGSRCNTMVKEVLLSPYLLRDIPKLSPRHQTYGLEVFHSVVNQFAPKHTHFFYSAMKARVYIAVLHYNENGGRQQSKTKDGTLQWKMSYPKEKKGTECVVKPQRVDPTYDYVDKLMEEIMQRRIQTPTFKAAQDSVNMGHRALEPNPLTAHYKEFLKEDPIERRRSRFGLD